MSFKIGDKVVFVDEIGGGTVSKITKQFFFIMDSNGFEIPCIGKQIALSEPIESKLVKHQVKPSISKEDEAWVVKPKIKKVNSGEKSPQLDKDELYKLKKRRKSENLAKWKKSEKGIPVVDLHLHELIENDSGLDDFTKLMIQIEHFEKAMQDVRRHRYPRFIIVHGIGKGRLKSEIRTRLGTYKNLQYYDAPIKEFGFGATEVNIWFS
jgi:hypothetical protein